MSEEETKKLIHKKEEEESKSNSKSESNSESESEEEKTNKKMNELILSEEEEEEEEKENNGSDDDDDNDEEMEEEKKEEKKGKKEVLCVECEFSPAILTCPQCGNDPLCKLCFVTLHRKGCRHEHTPIPIPTKEHQFESPFQSTSTSTTPTSSTSSDEQKKQSIIKQEGLFGYDDDDDDSSSSSDDDDYRYGWFSWWGSNSSKSFHERKAERDRKRAEKEARRQQREAARGTSHKTLIDVTTKDSVFERAAYIPLRLTQEERKRLKLLIAALEASDYTDVVDAARFASGNPRARARRTTEQIRGICAVLLGITLAVDPEAGRELEESKDYAKYAAYYKSVFEIGRRHKIRNPDFMRTVYTKLMYIVQDSLLPEVEEMLGFNLAAPLRTVRSFLEERHAENVLKDNLIEIATMEILSEGKSRQQVAQDIKTKERAIERIAGRYKTREISDEEIKTCLYSISDNNNFLRFNRDPIDTVITWLKEMFPAPSKQQTSVTSSSPVSPNSQVKKEEGEKEKKRTRKLEFVERKIEPELSLAIDGGKDGSRLTHTHERQYLYVMQSLTLWREIQHDMYRLWVLAEQDLLRTESPYVLKDTGQGLQRVQQAPQIYRAMQAILQATQAQVGSWVGSSIIHIGDEQVPNALFFIDKYTQVPKILSPIVLTVKHVQNMPADGVWKIPHKYVLDTYGSLEEAKNVIMLDFFKRAFDGSGADNFFDAGSCIDGRLTSAWQWCASLNSKPFFHLFLFSGFIGFDGLWK